MFELPECLTLSAQIDEELRGKRVVRGELGNSPHKFVWYNRSHEDFRRLVAGKRIGTVTARGRWIFVPLDPGFVLVFGECGGRLLLHPAGFADPAKYHLLLEFENESRLTMTTQMWGAMELYEQGKELEREYIRDMRPTPVDEEFSFTYFSTLIDSLAGVGSRSVKALLTAEQLIPGLGNSIAQDIMFRAQLHPRHALSDLDAGQRKGLHTAIVSTVREAIEKGGRSDELDLYGHRGGYERLMDSRAVGRPCPMCGAAIEKISYLGGACYLCPVCQK